MPQPSPPHHPEGMEGANYDHTAFHDLFQHNNKDNNQHNPEVSITAAVGMSTIVRRGALNPLFYNNPPPFFQIFSNPPSLLPPTPNPHCSFCCLVSLAEWVIVYTTFDVLFYLMISWMYKCQALGPWCMFYGTRHKFHSVHWDNDYNFIISAHDITNKILSCDSNHIVDLVMWQSLITLAFLWQKV